MQHAATAFISLTVVLEPLLSKTPLQGTGPLRYQSSLYPSQVSRGNHLSINPNKKDEHLPRLFTDCPGRGLNPGQRDSGYVGNMVTKEATDSKMTTVVFYLFIYLHELPWATPQICETRCRTCKCGGPYDSQNYTWSSFFYECVK